MNDLKLPVFLLVCLIAGVGYYFYANSQKPAPVVKPKVVKTISEEEFKEKKAQEEADFVKKVSVSFEKGDYKETLKELSEHQNSTNYDIQRMLAYSFSYNKEYDRAIIAFEKLLKIRKMPIDGYALALIYEVTGRYSAAASLYMELAPLSLPPNLKKNVLEGIARISVCLPENEDFYRYIEKLIEDHPDSQDGVIGLIKLKHQNNKFDNIDSLVETGNKFFENNFTYNYELAQLYEDAGKLDESLTFYKKCIKLEPKTYSTYLDCYRLLKNHNKSKEAVEVLEPFLESGQLFYPTIFFETAESAHKLKLYRQAFRFYLAAVISNPKLLGKEDGGLVADIETYYKTNGSKNEKVLANAFISFLNGDYKTTLSDIESNKTELDKSKLKSDSQALYDACDKLYKADKKRDDEIKAYEDYVMAKESEERLRQLAAKQKKEEASKVALGSSEVNKMNDSELKVRALKNNKDYNIQMETANAFFARQKLLDAKVYLVNAANINKTAHMPYFELAKIYSIEKDYAKAKNNIQEAIKRNPSDVNSLSFASTICLNNNELDAAKEYAESAIRLSPNNSIAKISLAKIYAQQGDIETANGIIDNALVGEKSNIIKYELTELRKQINSNE